MTEGGRPASLKTLLRFAVALILTAYVVWAADPARVVAAAASAEWRWIAAALGFVLLDRALMAYRWMLLLCALAPGSRPPFRAVLRIFFVSTFVGSFLPSLAGDVYRAYSLARLHVDGPESAASVIMDRALGVLSMVLVAVVSLAFADEMLETPGVLPTLSLAVIGCAAGALAIYHERTAAVAGALASRLPGRKPGHVAGQVLAALRRYRRHPAELTSVLASSVGVQVLRIAQASSLGFALGIQAPLWAYFVFIPLIVLVMQLPVTISGLGTSQLMFAVFFRPVGVPAAEAVALSILFVALALVGNLPGAVLYATGQTRPDEAHAR